MMRFLVVIVTVSSFNFCSAQAKGYAADSSEVAVRCVADHAGLAMMSDLRCNLSARGAETSGGASAE